MIPVESDLSRDGPPRTTGRRGGRSSEAGNAISKAFRVLEEVAARVGVQQLGEISAAARVPKSSTYRILATLVELGYVIRDHNHEYLAGPRLLALGSEVTSSTASLENLLAGLSAEVGETVHLGLRSGDHAVYIHKVEGRQPYFMASYVGMRLGLHCTAIGKCILAHLPEAEVAAIAERTGLRPRTTATITDPARLADELATIRQRQRGERADDSLPGRARARRGRSPARRGEPVHGRLPARTPPARAAGAGRLRSRQPGRSPAESPPGNGAVSTTARPPGPAANTHPQPTDGGASVTRIDLHPDRLLPADPARRDVARRLYQEVRGLPIVRPTGTWTPPSCSTTSPSRWATPWLKARTDMVS